jgi:mannose-6-phosphate isomerase-like protein (cupin superfamily)
MSTTEQRPWGAFTILLDAPHTKVKQLTVQPGQRLSLQLHHQREEHWIVVKGVATITVGHNTWTAPVGHVIHIPVETQHRLANLGTEPVEIIEVQLGQYFGEDDIVRLQDDYHREADAS